MMIYPEAGTVRADYADGTHVIHYASASIVPGQTVSFTSATRSDEPAFRLTYRLATPKTLRVEFAAAAPGGRDFRPIATGTLTRVSVAR